MKLYEFSDYIEKVNELFKLLEGNLTTLLPNARVEHIGASSIPGSVSKGDLDIFVGVGEKNFDESLKIIKSIGFYEKKDTLRTDVLCMLVTEKYNYDVAIQLVVNGSEQENFITFRDLLREKASLLKEYNQIKLAAKDLPDHLYREEKSKFISKVLRK